MRNALRFPAGLADHTSVRVGGLSAFAFTWGMGSCEALP
jgi:hypothetical protein